MRPLLPLFASLALGGCLGTIPEGTFGCDPSAPPGSQCPDDWTCRADSTCWRTPEGTADAGELPDGGMDASIDAAMVDASIDAHVPVDAPPDSGPRDGGPSLRGVVGISASTHTCALTRTGVLCWGLGRSGQLGDGTMFDSTLPRPVAVPAAVGGSFEHIAVGGEVSCGGRGVALWCWGSNSQWQLGTTTSSLTWSLPMLTHTFPSSIDGIAIGNNASCVRLGGELQCWGQANLGSDSSGSASPQIVVEQVGTTTPLANRLQVSSSAGFSCSRGSSGERLVCWGSNLAGNLGNGTTESSEDAPVPVSGLRGTGIVDVSAGAAHVCAITNTRELWCWGYNYFGQLGTSTPAENSSVPVKADLPAGARAEQVAAGVDHTCVLLEDDRVLCWGNNFDGAVGVESFEEGPTATFVLSGAAEIAAGQQRTCARMNDETLWCWGRYPGNGTERSRTPVVVPPVD